ncbi:beta barrel domain-containing protein [Paenibacillus medicaginis]|uniref:IDEAL domain-containing protein n=1 Tax=Paenibacillus medicaginis TaxID=1470560 RepID=A0ABV5BUR3_9BACL
MQVGETVYLKAVGNNARHRKEVYIKEDVITKVGRKYFEVGADHRPLKFQIDGLKQETGGYTADWKLYFSMQEILDEEEFQRISREIENIFRSYDKVKLTLDQLRRIKTIIYEPIQ